MNESKLKSGFKLKELKRETLGKDWYIKEYKSTLESTKIFARDKDSRLYGQCIGALCVLKMVLLDIFGMTQNDIDNIHKEVL